LLAIGGAQAMTTLDGDGVRAMHCAVRSGGAAKRVCAVSAVQGMTRAGVYVREKRTCAAV
jgi:hypothetical protein